MFKYDVHAHTDEVSPCGHIPAQDLVKLYSEAGYRGIVITDHYHAPYFDRLGDISWADKVDAFLLGYYEAKESGYRYNVEVFLGMELRFLDTSPNDFLVYGFDEKFLLDYPMLYEYNLEEFNELKAKYDLLIYQAHPYRDNCSIAEPGLLDGVEVYNGHPRHNSRNHLALDFAKENNILMLSGSDAHQIPDVGRGGFLSTTEIDDYRQLVDHLKDITENHLIRSD